MIGENKMVVIEVRYDERQSSKACFGRPGFRGTIATTAAATAAGGGGSRRSMRPCAGKEEKLVQALAIVSGQSLNICWRVASQIFLGPDR